LIPVHIAPNGAKRRRKPLLAMLFVREQASIATNFH